MYALPRSTISRQALWKWRAQHFCVQPQRQRGRRPTDDAKGAVGCLFVGAFVSLFFGPWAVLWFVSAAVPSCVCTALLYSYCLFFA